MGARVAVHAHRNVARAEEIVASLGGDHIAVVGDLTDPDAAARVVEEAGDVTILVNAAYPHVPPVLFRDAADVDVEGHLDGIRMHLNVCRPALVHMRAAGGGRIVLLSGALAARPFPGFTLYTAAKAALTAFCRGLALEEGRAGITVNVVAPGEVETDAGGSPVPAPYADLDAVIRTRMALPELPRPEDVAATVCFLVSEAAAQITGQVVYLTAGEPIV
jgi:3-oxoacyl-[acyl-carrier protein] reductase